MFLSVEDMQPVILGCRRFNGYPLDEGVPYAVRTVHDYEFEYYLRSDGGIEVDGEYLAFKAGEMSIRKPGQQVRGVPPYSCLILCVDMAGNHRRKAPYGFGTLEEAQPVYQNRLLDAMPDRMIVRKKHVVSGLLESIERCSQAEGELQGFQAKAALYLFLQEVFRQESLEQQQPEMEAIQKAVGYVRDNYDKEIQVEELVKASGFSKSYFHAAFKRCAGMPPGQLIAGLRIEKAKDLLCMTGMEIAEVGVCCGYEDSAYFSRIFRRQTGISPSAFRQAVQQ